MGLLASPTQNLAPCCTPHSPCPSPAKHMLPRPSSSGGDACIWPSRKTEHLFSTYCAPGTVTAVIYYKDHSNTNLEAPTTCQIHARQFNNCCYNSDSSRRRHSLTVYTRTECSLRVRGSSKSFATAMTL